MSESKIRSFRVVLEMPEGVDIPVMEEYIENAVKSSNGCLHPQDPLFNLSRDSVRVQYISGRVKNKRRIEETKETTHADEYVEGIMRKIERDSE